jgi:YVTN family beta-propeller protein
MKEMKCLFGFLWVLMASALLAQERLYVVQSGDESLGAIDLASGTVNSHVLALGNLCNDITVHGTRLYVTNSGFNTVQEIDAESNATLRDIPIPGGVSPYSLAFLNADTFAVTNWTSDNAVLIRVSDGAAVGTLPIGLKPEGITVYEGRFYVCLSRYLDVGSFGPGAVMVYDCNTLEFVDSIQVGMNPQYAAVDDRGRLHIVCSGSYGMSPGQINIVNAVTLHTDTVLAIGGSPSNISFGGDFAFVAAGGWAGEGNVYRYRLSDLTILNGEANPIEVGEGAWDVEGRPDGSFFVSCFSTDSIEHRGSDGQWIAGYPMSVGPGQMAIYGTPDEASLPRKMIPRQFALTEAYPNPFNSAVRLRLSIPAREQSYILIYNDLGQEVARLNAPAGTQELLWNPQRSSPNSITSGIYYAVWELADPKMAQRLIYLK